MATRRTFGRNKRLSGEKAFARVFAAKCSASNQAVVIYAVPNGLKVSRLGLTVGRKHGLATSRNRVKRLLREAFRAEADALPAGYDLVCVPRAGEITTLAEARRALRTTALRAIERCAAKAD